MEYRKVEHEPLVKFDELSFDAFLSLFLSEWHQGEHIDLIGPTGTGKTTVAHKVLTAREYVCVLAIKRQDDTLDQFTRHAPRYKIIQKWPPTYLEKRVILWKKPRSLDREDVKKQALSVHKALNQMYLSGGWCIYLDEAGYIAGVLGLSQAIGILLNQGRSAFLSIAVTTTRPSSVVARIPKEALNQVRHHLIFKFIDEREMKTCGEIVGLSLPKMRYLQSLLVVNPGKGFSDFLYFAKGKVYLIRNS